MDLKEFKTGIEALSRLTNQRLAEPDPFVMQIGKDGGLSLIASDGSSTLVWRTGTSIVDRSPVKEAFSSKVIVQAAKALKGKGVSVHFKVEKDHLVVFTSPAGGSIKLQFISELPALFKPPTGNQIGSPVTIADIDRFVKAMDACSSSLYDYVSFGADGDIRVTDSYKVFEMQIPSMVLSRSVRVSASFWNVLRGAQSNAEAIFYESGVRVRFDTFEAFTGFVEGQDLPPMRKTHFPDGETPDAFFLADRRSLIASIKAVAPDTKDQQIRMSREDNGAVVLKGIQYDNSVEVKTSRGRGSGRCSLSAKFAVDILNAITGKEVIVAWQKVGPKPIMFKDASHQAESYLLAPVWKQ